MKQIDKSNKIDGGGSFIAYLSGFSFETTELNALDEFVAITCLS